MTFTESPTISTKANPEQLPGASVTTNGDAPLVDVPRTSSNIARWLVGAMSAQVGVTPPVNCSGGVLVDVCATRHL
ncbi:MAG: hypothetical protein IPJ05_02900 [Nitrosomonas sp.]|nr:hypothetical protein [Nitrosomonas sp.]